MNYSKEEKQSIIIQLIQIAKADSNLKNEELEFIKRIANMLGISDTEFDTLVNQPFEEVILKPESERILQFHRLVLVMNVDQKTGLEEVATLKNFGLKMGLPPTAIDDVLEQMANYENKVIPPNILLEIFKKHYN